MVITEKQKRKLEYFKNKIVSFFVNKINRDFDKKEMDEYFIGKITEIDEAGIWYVSPTKPQCFNFIFYDKITSISEEEVVLISDIEQEYINEFQVNVETEEIKAAEDKKTNTKIQAPPENLDDFINFIS